MKYSIVIPTYNHCDDLLKPCVESIFKYTNVSDIELIISANGCTDNTAKYLNVLREHYNLLGMHENFKVVWSTEPQGYSRACNAGIGVATCPLIVLLNNDTILLEQEKNRWLNQLELPFKTNEKCGISCIIKSESEPAGHDFAIFFCVMIHRKVFDKIGLLSLDYGAGGGEDTEFSIECERAGFEVCECVVKKWDNTINSYSGDFPIYHIGEGTVHDKTLVPDWDDIFLKNSLTLAKKYNPKWYQWRLSNYSERAVFFKGDVVFPREATRYSWAAENIIGNKVFELGCSSGFGVQFLPQHIEYTGLDYDKLVIEAAKDQNWRENLTFIHGDINTYELDQYDTIIAFEVIEHLDTGLAIVEKLKKHCKRLIITVPMLEAPELSSPHHKLYNLNESHFSGFKFKYIRPDGSLCDEISNKDERMNNNLLLCVWDSDNDSEAEQARFIEERLSILKEQDPLIYNEVITSNHYDIKEQELKNRSVIDIGANIGCFSLLAAAKGAKMVIGVEPVTTTFLKFRSNVENFGYINILPMKYAVTAPSNESKYLKISTNNNNSGANSLYNIDTKYEEVPTISLDSLLKLCPGDDVFLKLDCEGAEYDIILGATKESMSRIKTIVLEVHSELHPYYKGRPLIENKLVELGFKNTKLQPIFYFTYDANGNLVSSQELPYSNQRWEKNEQ